ncbi:MAG: peptidoglycan-associated lipoprotein [Desulfobacteraceae bacterium 4484_190.2]|nr:MAG: peptidoglycan-associated lipoprotein [Desulfobacteraceae bacterium 4484_190.2]
MGKRMMTGVIVLAFICSSFLLMTSCAKKQIQVSEPVQPATQEMKAEEDKAKAAEEAKSTAEQEAKARAEAERQARLRELKMAQKLADEIRNFEAENIYFAFDRSDLTDESKSVLREKGNWLRANGDYSVNISGNCDERGTAEYNLALGERRAHAAKKFLMGLGISENRLATISYGEEKPVDPGHNDEAWAKNRNDQFTLTK